MIHLDFEPLGLHHRPLFEAALARTVPLLPSSDFSHTSALAWGGEAAGIARLTHGFALRLPAYTRDQPDVLTWLATTTRPEEARRLALLAADEGLTIQLLPEATRLGLPAEVHVELDAEGNLDYIYDCAATVALDGRRWQTKRRELARVEPTRAIAEELDLTSGATRDECLEVFQAWASGKGGLKEHELEWRSFGRFLDFAPTLDLFVTGIRIDGRLSAFAVVERFGVDGALSHYEKALAPGSGLATYLRVQTLRTLVDAGRIWVSGECDLGLQNLRHSKRSWRPIRMLEKYRLVATDRRH